MRRVLGVDALVLQQGLHGPFGHVVLVLDVADAVVDIGGADGNFVLIGFLQLQALVDQLAQDLPADPAAGLHGVGQARGQQHQFDAHLEVAHGDGVFIDHGGDPLGLFLSGSGPAQGGDKPAGQDKPQHETDEEVGGESSHRHA